MAISSAWHTGFMYGGHGRHRKEQQDKNVELFTASFGACAYWGAGKALSDRTNMETELNVTR